MERQEFKVQVDTIGRSSTNMDTARIVFTDGESHVVPTWTIEESDKTVGYNDVHTMHGSAKLCVPYTVIARVEPYGQRKMSS